MTDDGTAQARRLRPNLERSSPVDVGLSPDNRLERGVRVRRPRAWARHENRPGLAAGRLQRTSYLPI